MNDFNPGDSEIIRLVKAMADRAACNAALIDNYKRDIVRLRIDNVSLRRRAEDAERRADAAEAWLRHPDVRAVIEDHASWPN